MVHVLAGRIWEILEHDSGKKERRVDKTGCNQEIGETQDSETDSGKSTSILLIHE